MASRPESAATKTASFSAWRIADGRFEIYSAVGASLIGGRWNSPGHGVIYACRTFAGAMLECLAHAGIGRVPRTQVALHIQIPGNVSVETPLGGSLPAGWFLNDQLASRAFGDAWIRERRSAVLVVPSVVARHERNVLINPQHAHFRRIKHDAAEAVVWDQRLFSRS